MKTALLGFILAAAVLGQQEAKVAATLPEVRRIYVGQLTGGATAEALRDLIIASLNSTKLFVLTENEAKADAILKGAGDDNTFTDTFDTYEGSSGRDSLGKTGSALTTKIGSAVAASTLNETESHHSRERKHEAYATVRLCNKDGDVLWSTTQESMGAKFRGASADVAAKIARQISIDYEKSQRASVPKPATAQGGTAAVKEERE